MNIARTYNCILAALIEEIVFNFLSSHFLLTLVCSSNFFIYYFKHGSLCKSRRKADRAKMQTEMGSPAATHTNAGGQTTTLMNMTIETSIGAQASSTRPELLRLSTW